MVPGTGRQPVAPTEPQGVTPFAAAEIERGARPESLGDLGEPRVGSNTPVTRVVALLAVEVFPECPGLTGVGHVTA